MITEEQKYRAEILKITGFALIAPFGKVFLTLPFIEIFKLPAESVLYMLLTIGLTIIGIIILSIGVDLITERNN